MKKLLLITVLLLNTVIFAQKGGLKGRVLDETKQPLPGASILLVETKTGTATDFDGNYELLNVKTGEYTISVSFIGYKTVEQKVTISEGITRKDFDLVPETNQLEEVVILGAIGRGQAKALNKQKTNDNITNVISSDQVGKFPDANIGDALKRVPGIAMQNDQGEARDIIVRGMAPQLNSVTLNGDKLPSAEGDNRRVQMDLIPSDMIQTIEVSKAVTPDMEADAIGGSVNLVTRSAPAKFRGNITGSYGMNPIRDGSNYTVSGLVSGRTKDKKVGAVLNASYNSNDYGSDNVEFEWKNKDLLKDYQIRRYDVRRIRKSLGLNLDWKPNENHTFEFKSIYNERDDRENRFRLRYKYDDDDTDDPSDDLYKVYRETKGGIDNDDNKNRRLERQSTYKFGIGGDHIVFGNVKADWKISTSKAKEKRPHERYITYKTKIDFADVDKKLSDIRKPFFNTPLAYDNNEFELDEVVEETKYTQEQKIGSRINIKIPLTTEGDYQNSIKFGYKYKYKEKERENNYLDYTSNYETDYELMTSVPTSDQTLSDYLPGSKYKSGNFVTNAFLGSLNFNDLEGKPVLDEFVPANYNAEENIYAFYVMLKQDLGEQLSIIVGARVESTDVDYNGYRLVLPTKDEEDNGVEPQIENTYGNKKYANFLPNLQLKYKPSNNLVVRAAWTNTIARPNYYDIVPYENINRQDSEIAYGNPDLEATKSMNFDLMGEYYFKNVGIFSLGGFYKNIDGFIYEQTKDEDIVVQNNPAEEYEVTRSFNGGTAKVYGFEASLQRKLNFLPGFLRNLTFYGNYTYTGSETDGIKDRDNGLELAGAIEHMVNTSLAYETKKLTLRGSLNFASDYINEYGGKEFEDIYYDKQTFVDVNASYEIYKGLRIFAEGKNLTNQPLRYYQGEGDRTLQLEYYNINWNVGLKYNF